MAIPSTSDTPEAAAPASLPKQLRWWLPAATVFVLTAATLALFALSDIKEKGEERERLVADTLLVRESIRFQLAREIEALELVALDAARGALSAEARDSRLQGHLRRAREVVGVALVDASLAVQAQAVRPGVSADFLGETPGALAESAIAKARAIGRPAFSTPFQAPWGASIALFVPVAIQGGGWNYAVAIYSLDALLDEMVPWTFAQEHEVTLADITGTTRGRRASAGAGRGVYTHQEPLELAGTTLMLTANSVKGPPDWIADLLRGGIATLAGVLLWSLWALRRDVQRRLTVEHRLREEAAFRRAMGDSAVIGLRARDMAGRTTYVNPAFAAMVGLREEELIGCSSPMPYWVPELHEDYQRRMEDVISGRASTAPYPTYFRRRGGERFPVAVYDAPLNDADGQQVGWMSSIVDVSEQKQAEEREHVQQELLQTAARLTTMGEIASSLAHELNQPLAAIASYLAGSINLIDSGNASQAELREVMGKAAAQAERAGQVIRRVHEFVRKHEPKRTEIDVGALIEECRPLVDLQARRPGVRVHVAVQQGLPAVDGDTIMLQQAILNLTRNAIEAMDAAPPASRHLHLSASKTAEGVRVSVRDFGCGIPEASTAKLYVPFYTTKPEGMGMGLSICRTIAEAHEGRLWFERHVDGTEFHLQLPALA